MADFDYSQKILKKKDAPNEKGVKSYFLFAPKSWFDALQGFKSSPAAAGDTILIDSDHTFLTGKGFVRVETTNEANFKIDQVGDLGGRGFNPKLEGFYPGNDIVAAEIFSHAKDDDVVALVPLADGQYLQMGREGLWAQMSANYDTGTQGGGKNGWNVMVESFNGTPIYYTGAITEKPDPE